MYERHRVIVTLHIDRELGPEEIQHLYEQSMRAIGDDQIGAHGGNIRLGLVTIEQAAILGDE